LEPKTLAIAMEAPAAPFRAKIIIEIFSGISPAIGLIITAKTIVDIPTSIENDCKDEIKSGVCRSKFIIVIVEYIHLLNSSISS
jgi:hypothetical protein